MNRAGLMMTRPQGDSTIVNDLPNENGIPNHSDGAPGCTGNSCPDNHDTLTGSTSAGMLLTGTGTTCSDWTSAVGSAGRPGLGHSWPANSGMSWMQVHAGGRVRAERRAHAIRRTARGRNRRRRRWRLRRLLLLRGDAMKGLRVFTERQC